MNMIQRAIALSGRADNGLSAEVSRLLRNPSFLASSIFDFLAPSARRERTETVALLAHDIEISNRVIPTRRLEDAVRWFEYAIRNTLEHVLRQRERVSGRKAA